MHSPLRLLIIEDSETDAKLLIRHIQREGYNVLSKRVDTPVAMKESLTLEEWDVIISDYSMPQFNGIEALSLLQSMNLDIPFIMISGVMGEDTAVAAMQAGAHDYMMKDNLLRLVPAIEREIRDAEQRRVLCIAQEQINFLSQALAQSKSLVMMTDISGTIEYVNPTLIEVSGYSHNDVIGYDLSDFFNMSHQFNLEDPSSKEILCKRKDSNEYWVSIHVSPVRGVEGMIQKYLIIQEDITERKLLELQLQDYTKQLEYLVDERTTELSEKNHLLELEVAGHRTAQAKLTIARDKAFESLQIKNQILANVNHDIQTPLSIIRLYAQLLHRSTHTLLNEKQQQKIELIIEQVSHLSKYFSQMLTIANVESNRIDVQYDNLKLDDFLSTVLLSLKPLADNKQLKFTQYISSDMPNNVLTDRNLLQHIVEQLMVNAIQYTKQGKVEIHIMPININSWCIEVIDTGIGIPKERQFDIFEPFWQIDGSASRLAHKGSGIGLSIVKQYVEAMNGTVTVESDGKSGSRFKVELPIGIGM